MYVGISEPLWETSQNTAHSARVTTVGRAVRKHSRRRPLRRSCPLHPAHYRTPQNAWQLKTAKDVIFLGNNESSLRPADTHGRAMTSVLWDRVTRVWYLFNRSHQGIPREHSSRRITSLSRIKCTLAQDPVNVMRFRRQPRFNMPPGARCICGDAVATQVSLASQYLCIQYPYATALLHQSCDGLAG